MKKLKAIQILGVIALAIFMPLMLQGCMGGGKEKLTLSQQFRTYYYVGEAIDLDGGMVKYTNEDGDELNLNITAAMISGFSTKTAGTRTMYVTYNEKQVAVDYVVYEISVVDKAVYTCNGNMSDDPERWMTAKFDLQNNKFWANTPPKGEFYSDSQGVWQVYSINATQSGLELTINVTEQGVTSIIRLYNITENSFTMYANFNGIIKTLTFTRYIAN